MLVKTNAIQIRGSGKNDTNLFDPSLLTLKRCEILNSSSNSLKLKGTSTDGYHADYVINGLANKMKILTLSCEFQSTTQRGNVVVYAGTSQSDADSLYSFDEVTDLGKVSLCIPITEDYMEIRFGCSSDYTSISEVTFTDIQITISEKPILLNGSAYEDQVLEGQTFYNSLGLKKGTMVNQGAWDISITPEIVDEDDVPLGESYKIPAGFHNGDGEISVSEIHTQSKTVTPSTSKRTVSPDAGKLLSSVIVNAIQTQSKTVTPSTSQQTVTPDSGKYLNKVIVDKIPDGAVGCTILFASGLGSGQNQIVDTQSTVMKKGADISVFNGIGYIDGSNDKVSWANLGTYNDGGSSSSFTGSATHGYVQNTLYRYIRFRYNGHSNGGSNFCVVNVFRAG